MTKRHTLRALLSLLVMAGSARLAYFVVLLPEDPVIFWGQAIGWLLGAIIAVILFAIFFATAWQITGWAIGIVDPWNRWGWRR